MIHIILLNEGIIGAQFAANAKKKKILGKIKNNVDISIADLPGAINAN